jgi:hypothetical protein
MKRLALLTALLVLPTPAFADAAERPSDRGAEASQAASGRASIGTRTGLVNRRRRFVQRGQMVIVRGRVRDFVAGQFMVVRVKRGRRVGLHRVPIRKAERGLGTFTLAFRAERRGRYRVRAVHSATAQQRHFSSRTVTLRSINPRAGVGAGGLAVRLLQRNLLHQGYATPLNGYFGAATARAVLAFRKVNGQGESGFASRRVFFKLFRKRGRFRVRYRRPGRHVEYDWSRQVLVLVRRGRAWRTYHSSSGKASTPTVFGAFRFYRKQPGTNAKGMVHSNYFIGGYAIHGYKSVPTYPASHGCIRIPIPNAAQVNRRIRIGERIFVYR